MSTLGEYVVEGDGQRDAAALLALYGLTDRDLEQVRSVADAIVPRIDAVVGVFYVWMREHTSWFEEFFSDPELHARVSNQQIEYWKEFFRADVTEAYVDSRRRIGGTHAEVGVPLDAYFAAVNHFGDLMSNEVNGLGIEARELVGASINKLLYLDVAAVVETYALRVNELLSAQNRAVIEMSTPVTQVWDEILLLPLAGIIDSKRAQEVMNAMLKMIDESRSRVFILDISGVGVVDTGVANHLIKITKATRLMGCECIISGVSPSIAQTIVDLGIDTGRMRTTSTMQDALAGAFATAGVSLVSAKD